MKKKLLSILLWPKRKFDSVLTWYRMRYTGVIAEYGSFVKVGELSDEFWPVYVDRLKHDMLRTSRRLFCSYRRELRSPVVIAKSSGPLDHPCHTFSTVAWKATSFPVDPLRKMTREHRLGAYIRAESGLVKKMEYEAIRTRLILNMERRR